MTNGDNHHSFSFVIREFVIFLGNVFQEADHLQGGFGGFGAFVPDVAAGAMDRLLYCFTRKYAEQHGKVCVD